MQYKANTKSSQYAAEDTSSQCVDTNYAPSSATTNETSTNNVPNSQIKTSIGIVRPPGSADETRYLAYQSSFTEQFAARRPKHIAALSLTCMIKVLAQMKNLRRSHHDQGHLKKIQLDYSHEGYSNYMAPMRMKKIEHDITKSREKAEEDLRRAKNDQERKAAEDRLEQLDAVFNNDILRPATDTYLSPEWNEMLPFPTSKSTCLFAQGCTVLNENPCIAWKVRFNGFGDSDYNGEDLNMLWQAPVPDDQPPYYQPNGPSHVGGSFATWNTQDTKFLPKLAANGVVDKNQLISAGCGMANAGA